MFNTGFPPEWSTFKKLIWLVGSGIAGAASGIWKTVTGALIHITDALASPMQKCEVTLEPIQDLHGQDAPYPAGGGKNKFSSDNGTYGIWISSNGDITQFPTGYVSDYIDVLQSNNYALSLINTNENFYSIIIVWYNSSDAFIERQIDYAGGNYPKTLNPPENAAKCRIGVTRVGQDAITKSIVDSFKIQFEEGTTATSWSPFENICPITGWTGCEVTRTGKNLYPYTTIPAYNYAWYSGSKALADATNPVFLKGGAKYAVSADQSVAATTSAIVRAWRADGTILENAPNVLNLKDPISGTTATYQSAPKYYQLSTPNYAKPFTNIIEPTEDLWIDMRCSGDSRVGNDPMIQIGDSRTTYEPYSGTTLSVTFPDTVYGGKSDFVSGKVPVTWREIVFDGVINKVNVVSSSYIGATTTRGYKTAFATNAKSPVNAMCDCAKWQPNVNEQGYQGFYFNPSNGEVNIRVLNSETGITSEDTTGGNGTATTKMNAYLAEHPLTIVYELAEPTEITLTPQEIGTLKGENNVWSNGDSIEITYKAQSS